MSSQPNPSRFTTARSTLLWDRIMTGSITVGGIGVILAVLLICFFIVVEIIPIVRGAKVGESKVYDLPAKDFAVLACDSYTELPLLIEAKTGKGYVVNLLEDGAVTERDPALPDGVSVTAIRYSQRHQELTYGLSDGRFQVLKIDYAKTYKGTTRQLECNLDPGDLFAVGVEGAPIIDIDFADSGREAGGISGGEKVVAAIQTIDGRKHFHVAVLKQAKGLLADSSKPEIAANLDLTRDLLHPPHKVMVDAAAETVIVGDEGGYIYFFQRHGEDVNLIQRFQPFPESKHGHIAQMSFLFGDSTIIVVNDAGECRAFCRFVPDDHTQRLFGLTKQFPSLPGPADVYAISTRNKSFLIGSGQHLSLRYGTSAEVRWDADVAYDPELALISGKYNSILLTDVNHKLRVMELRDRYPEAGLRAFFAKIWYENQSQPKWKWESTGMTDEFEPKLSLVPLIYGTVKGTLYAMIFAVPIALLAALYTAQFQYGPFRKVVKPTMEVMASLPSVVLGFLGALWLAPLIETRVPAILIFGVMLPVTAILIGFFWGQLPRRYRRFIPDGWEFLAFAPLIIICWLLSDYLGPIVEAMWFTVKDPYTGKITADFRLWWPQITGTPFEQRNALVVGFMMGFAVIPIIFTITEDALSNVPKSLVSASDALGASRWQTAIRVVLPTASGGVFSAIMMGLGRAVGETMIVLMATGNTAIMEVNPFSGMRTLSANIAVELPEAPQGETLYRTLFLGALILFLMTWVINTFAEVLRQRLIKKYRTL